MGDVIIETPKQTLYQILGVAADASPSAIDAALQDAVDFDRNRLVFLQEAYSCLRDRQRRQAYDLSLKAPPSRTADAAARPARDGLAMNYSNQVAKRLDGVSQGVSSATVSS